jgi:hypothetical protein
LVEECNQEKNDHRMVKKTAAAVAVVVAAAAAAAAASAEGELPSSWAPSS